jgi:hypothetical protein
LLDSISAAGASVLFPWADAHQWSPPNRCIAGSAHRQQPMGRPASFSLSLPWVQQPPRVAGESPAQLPYLCAAAWSLSAPLDGRDTSAAPLYQQGLAAVGKSGTRLSKEEHSSGPARAGPRTRQHQEVERKT